MDRHVRRTQSIVDIASTPNQSSIDNNAPTTSRKDTQTQSLIKITKRDENCTIYGQNYECGPVYNVGGQHHTSYKQSLLGAGSEADPKEVWATWLEGQSSHDHAPQSLRKRTMKVVLMTMNEWPLLAWWTFYHGEMLGFENLYIIDSSDDERCIKFLKQARDEFNVNAIFSKSDLNSIVGDINEIMSSVSVTSDAMIKLDTDEFLAVVPDAADCPDQSSLQSKSTTDLEQSCRLSPYGVQKYIDSSSFLLDGSMLRIGFVSHSVPNREICDSPSKANDLAEYRFAEGTPVDFKAFFDSRTFEAVDLGSHIGYTLPPFKDQKKYTALGIIHFHSRCYQMEMDSSRQAVIRHGYIAKNAPDERALTRLQKFAWRKSHRRYNFPTVENNCTEKITVCPFPSCHKVHQVMQHLMCPEAMEENYYRGLRGNPNVEMAKYMRHLKEKYPIELL